MRSIPKLILAALFCLSLLAPRLAQALSFGIGPKVGANFSGAEVDAVDNEERRTGLGIGAVAEIGVTSPFSLVLEPMYLQRGARFEILNADARGDIDYFELPVLGKAKFGNLKTVHAYLFLGPSFGFKTSSEGRYAGFTDPFEDQVASFNVSGDIGAGLTYRLRHYVYLSGDLRYSHGFTDALEEDIGAIQSWYHRDVRLMGAVLIHLTE